MDDCMNYDPKSVFSTSDFETVVVLMYFGIPVAEMDGDGKRVTFHFQEPDKCRQMYMDFINDKLQVNPQKFLNVLNRVKGTVHQVKSMEF